MGTLFTITVYEFLFKFEGARHFGIRFRGSQTPLNSHFKGSSFYWKRYTYPMPKLFLLKQFLRWNFVSILQYVKSREMAVAFEYVLEFIAKLGNILKDDPGAHVDWQMKKTLKCLSLPTHLKGTEERDIFTFFIDQTVLVFTKIFEKFLMLSIV